MTLSRAIYLQEWERNASVLFALGASILETPVTTCGDWDGHQLLDHLRRVYERAERRVGIDRDPEFEFTPSDPEHATALLIQAFSSLREVIEELPDEYPAWNWTGGNQTVSFLVRRMAHETSIHALDAGLAAGPIDFDAFFDPAFARDGIDEFFTLVQARPGARKSTTGESWSLHLHATDIEACEWLVDFAPESFSPRPGHAKADLAMRGSASAIYGWVWNRVPDQELEVHGRAELAQRWRAEVSI